VTVADGQRLGPFLGRLLIPKAEAIGFGGCQKRGRKKQNDSVKKFNAWHDAGIITAAVPRVQDFREQLLLFALRKLTFHKV
jgi:hypothetical protein